ncbi:hypothetical protein EBS02_01125 [bacterium]|nr:hypothetical protein [bacterium]
MLDFLNKSQSFLTLLAIDDPDNTGSSVLDTEYKSSLQVVFGLDSLEEVQALVDSQFDKLASNVNVSRNPAEQSRGVVTLYSVNLPSSSLTVTPNTVFTANLDSGAVNFKSLSSIVIDPEEFSSYLNRETGRYEIPIPVIAEKSGTSGNVDAGSVSLTNITNFLVTNLTPMVYGSDQESNRSLAERSLNALMGVDFGTIGGYIKEVISHPGVIKVASQGAGDRFMVRDYDFFRKSNLGGKVDLYIQGNRPLTYQEEFGINFIRVEDERVTDFEPGSLTFELDYKVENLEKVVVLRTGSRQEYALEGALLTGRKIILSPTNLKNTKIGLYSGDVILVTYYYASDFSYQLKHSPVLSIESVDRPTGRLGNENYRLDLSEDILRKGSSSQSPSSVRLIESSGVNFSAGVFEETATLNGTVPYPLLQYSIDLSKLIVSGTSGVYTLGRDFDIIDKGSNSTKTTIARKIGTRIADGESVSISYVASETFIIRYTVDNLIESIQTDLEKKEYATADVLVKRANVVPIDISAEVLINRGTSQSEVDLKIRTALGNHFSNLRLGDSVYQSDIIRIIDSVDGVYAVTTPIVKLSRAYNSYVVGDEIKLTGPRREGSSLVYRFDNTLSFDTINGGGILDLYTIRPVGMYINSRYFKGVSSLNEVFSLKNCCYITKSYIYISSLSESDLAEISKSDSKIIANYFSYEDKGVYDVKINAFEYPNLNNALFSYRNRQ